MKTAEEWQEIMKQRLVSIGQIDWQELRILAAEIQADAILPFRIEERSDMRVLVFTNGGCRPATDAECSMWDLIHTTPPMEAPRG